MSATDVRPQAATATEIIPNNRGGFTGAPRSPEGSGSGYNGLFRTEDYVTPVPTGNSTGGAVVVQGGNLSISDAAQTGLDLSTNFTLEGWTIGSLPSVNNTRKCIFSKLDGNGGYECSWFRDNTGALFLEFLLRQDSSNIGTVAPLFTSINYENTLYHHFGLVFQGGTTNLYIDGVGPMTTGTLAIGSVGNSAAGFFIASNPSGANQWFGTPSNFRVWSSARTQTQLIQDMRNDNPSGTGLQGFWKLGTDSLDSSGNGNHLTQAGTLSFGTVVPFVKYGATTRYYGGSGDGFVQTQGSPTFAGARNATTGNLANSNGTGGTVSDQHITIGDLYYISRVSVAFPTTTLTNSQVIVGAHAYVSPASGTSTNGNPSLDISQSSPASGTGIATSDFGSFGGTAGARVQHSFVGGAYGYIEFGTQALAWVNKGGTTVLGIRTANDMNNTAPTGNTLNQYILNMSEQTGTTTDPFLDVVTVPR